jgi:UMF1 family MFS transporter
MGTLLAIQFISVAGALGFSKLAERVSTKTALIFTLVGWSIVVIYAYFLTSSVEYFVMGAIVGLVQGGSQSLSRSFYGSIVPVHASAEFYGFYSVFNKGSAIFGPLAFSAIGHFTGNARTAILSLIIFFIVGLILLFLVDVEKAKEAKNSIIFKRQAF